MTGDSGTWKYGFIGFGIIVAICAGFAACNIKSPKTKKQKRKK